MLPAAEALREIACAGRQQQAMRAIINQKPFPPRLPDLRNLGTVLRILLAVNGLALVAALIRETRWEAVSTAWFDTTAIVEPHLLASLLLLYALAPWLERVPYRTGVIMILALTLGTTVALDALLATVGVPGGPPVVLRHAVFSLLATGLLLGYFHLRTKALSPAITEARLQALQARIRPHFLFNSINAVLSLVRSEPRRAETALEDLADLFRVLMRDNRQLSPLADEIEL